MDCPWPQGYTAKPANAEPHWVGSLKTLSTLSDSVRERESWLYTQRVLWGKPWQTGVTLSGLAKRAALHSPHHTICSKWRGYNGSSDGERERESQRKRELFLSKARWGFISCESFALTLKLICFAFSIRISIASPLSLELKIILKQRHEGFTSAAIKAISPPFRRQLRSVISPDETFSSPIHSQLANVIVIGLRGGVQGYYFVMMAHSYQLAHCSPATSDKTSSFSQHFP